MKQLPITGLAMIMALSAHAQYPKVKFADIVNQHEQAATSQYPDRFSIYDNPEKGEYQFNRWKWYWSQHTDKDGYIVPRKHAYNLWKAYEADIHRSAAKGTADQSIWKSIGPNVQTGTWLGYSQDGIGRINTMAFHPSDPDIFVVGTAGGGAWATDDGGGTWEPVTEGLMSPAVSDIDFNPQNPNTIYICTGDKNALPDEYNYDYNSIGLIKSIDGGDTWDTTGLTGSVGEGLRTNALLIDPVDTNKLLLCAQKNILRSFDGGDNWTDVTPVVPANERIFNIPELVANVANANIIYAPVTTVDPNTYVFRVRLMYSNNGGSSWITTAVVNDGFRAAIAVTKADPDVLKVIVANSDYGMEGIYHSGDGGASFIKIFDDNNCATNLLASKVSGQGCGGQGHYDLCIAVDPTDDLHVIVGGVNSWESKDGGVSWQILTQWAVEQSGVPLVHADHHYLGYHPLANSVLYDCNDGGISVFAPPPVIGGASVWTDIAGGMNITQYYRNAVAGNASFVLGGAQDNGSNMLSRATGISTSVGPGDGMECQIDPVDANIIYVSSQNGGFFKWDLRQGMKLSTLDAISDNIQGSPKGAWTTPMIINPNDNYNLVAGYQHVYSSPDQGENWKAISPQFSQLYRVAMSNASGATIYATEEESRYVHYTHDSGTTWTSIMHPYNDEKKISDIVVDHNDKERIWITFPGYGQNKNKVATYYQGAWTTMDENLPDLPVYCITQDTSNGTLYIGAYSGVFYRTPDMKQWERYATELPAVSVMDLGINYVTGELIAATWGRGMYASPKYEKGLSIDNAIPYAKDVIAVYPNPSGGSFVVNDQSGYFTGKEVSVDIINVAGEAVWSERVGFENAKLDLDTQLPAGSYVVHITGEDDKVASTRVTIIQQ